MRGLASLALATLLSTGCRHAPTRPPTELLGLSSAAKVYTLTNLHPDEDRVTLYSGNFQQPGLIPICSEVTFTYADPSYLSFTVAATGREYFYYEHAVAAEPLLVNASRYFGNACPKDKLAKLTPVERKGVEQGVPLKGMSKDAVVLACGYPPKRDTPSLDAKSWRYWSSRMRYFTVDFDARGLVDKVTY